MAALPRFISVTEAARRLGLPAKDLYRMVDAGKIKAAEINGETVVSEESLPFRKEDLPEYKKYAHLKGVGIWVSEAARKYKIPHGNLSRWAKAGVISVLGKDGNKTLIDEADVGYCSEIHKKRSGSGKWLFNPDGTPYQPKIM